MRSLRWLLLVAMAVIAAAVFGIYRAQRIAAGAKERPLPSVLPLGTVGNAFDYRWGQSANGKPKYEVIAKDATQLEGNKTEYDYQGTEPVPCAHALFPQTGAPPCWYLSRHSTHAENL